MTEKEELEKIKKLADAMYYAAQQLTTDASRLHKAMDEYHKFIIHECKEESVSEGLSEAASVYQTFHRYATPFKAYIDGANWQKEQLMANAVDVTVYNDAGGYPYILQMELYDYDKDIPLAKEGDKYKVILIKED